MAESKIKLEIEMRMYWVKQNPKWKPWKFWEPKEIRILSESDSADEELNKAQEEKES